MARTYKPVDISGLPELVRLAEEVRDLDEPRLLRVGEDDIAVLVPLRGASRKQRRKTEAELNATRSAAGSWADIDTDQLVEDIYARRRISDRPPVEL
jgi:hypothetical protein